MTSSALTQARESNALLLFTLGVYQYALMTSVFADIRIGPANLQVTVATLLFVVCALLRRDEVAHSLGWQSLLVLGLGLAFIPLKMLTGLLSAGGLQSMRMFFILPLTWGVYAAYATNQLTRERIATIIIWNCVFVALFGIVHFFLFPTVFLSEAHTEAYRAGNIYLIPGHSAEAAFFGNASGYGAILVCGLFAIYLTGRRTLPYIVAFFIIAAASYLSISRSTALFTSALFVLYLAGGVSFRRPKGLIPVFAVLVMGVYVAARVPYLGLAAEVAAGRVASLTPGGVSTPVSAFADPSQIGRLQRYEVGLQITFRDLAHVLVGSADTEEPIIGDVNFSDNSFIFLALAYGVPLTLLWVVTVLRRTVGMRVPRDLRRAMILLFIYVTLITTPGLSWDMWLVYAVGLLFIQREDAVDTFMAAEAAPSFAY